jgi:hypothetical protein
MAERLSCVLRLASTMETVVPRTIHKKKCKESHWCVSGTLFSPGRRILDLWLIICPRLLSSCLHFKEILEAARPQQTMETDTPIPTDRSSSLLLPFPMMAAWSAAVVIAKPEKLWEV